MCKINPRVDFAFKLIFGNEQNKDILISLLNSILEDYQTQPIASIEILNPFGSKEHERDKLTVLDIRARDDKGEFYNIEMQIADQYYYNKRATYYWARLYSSQLGEGRAYNNLKRTVSINILNFNRLEEKDYHSIYRIKNLKTGKDLHNQLEIHFIELEKFTRELPDLKKTLDRWIYFLKYADEFTEQNLPVPLKEIDTIEKAARILDKMSLTEEEREIYEARLKSLRDEDGALETARIKGLEEGMEKGKIELARELYEDGYPVEKLAAKFNVSAEKMKELLTCSDA